MNWALVVGFLVVVGGATAAADPAPPPAAPAAADPLFGTTINGALDLYVDYNFDQPIGRVNRLRAYDVSSNSISLNQANLVVENAADASAHKWWGARIDLQWGQATQTLQGNAANEARPDIYRDVFQAYGTLLVPIGGGVTIDAGKWASSLGLEGNYTKDQLTYSRSLWFDALPFYHMGLRAAYRVDEHLTVNYWIVNGTEATEAVNNYKDQLIGITATPISEVAWTASYYRGQEHPDTLFYPNGGAPAGSPTQQGAPFQPIADPPTGLLQILDTYATWQATPCWLFAAEADYVHSAIDAVTPAQKIYGGAAYARYQVRKPLSLSARAELLYDEDGLFTGTNQRVYETTVGAQYRVATGLLAMLEWRRDASDHDYFYTDTLGVTRRDQTTITLGATWWFGGKQGSW